jgi:hypothetical protein
VEQVRQDCRSEIGPDCSPYRNTNLQEGQKIAKLQYWDNEGPNNPEVYIEDIDHFDARGKFQVYGRGDIFGKTEFDMTIWRGHDRRMLVRFWSKDDDIEWRAFKIVGMLDTDITGSRMMGDWIPYCLRVAYDGWISDEW